jgi:catechol 2,3-dioxygenase-like lactoylglutathione lyase family enzyme
VLGHISFGVADLERSIAFYDAALAPLGLTRVWTNPNGAGYGYRGKGDLLALKKQSEAVRPPGPGFIWPSTRGRTPPWIHSIPQPL